MCTNGWAGENCNDCIVQPNCPGTCHEPFGCICTNSTKMGVCQIKDSPPKLTRSKQNHETMPYHCIARDNFMPKILSKNNSIHNWTSKKITKNVVSKEISSSVSTSTSITVKEGNILETTTEKYSKNVSGTKKGRSTFQNDGDLLELLHFGFGSAPTVLTTTLVSETASSPIPHHDEGTISPGIDGSVY